MAAVAAAPHRRSWRREQFKRCGFIVPILTSGAWGGGQAFGGPGSRFCACPVSPSTTAASKVMERRLTRSAARATLAILELVLNLNPRPCRTPQKLDPVVPCALRLLSKSAVCLEPAIRFRACGRCERKSRQTRPSPKAVVAPLSRARTKNGAICAATRRAGANFPHFFVARRSQTPGMRRSSLRELGKIGSQRRARQSEWQALKAPGGRLRSRCARQIQFKYNSPSRRTLTL